MRAAFARSVRRTIPRPSRLRTIPGYLFGGVAYSSAAGSVPGMGLFKKVVAEVPVPGEVTVTLAAGKVTINYEEQRMGRDVDEPSRGKEWYGVPGGVEVMITPTAGGAPLTIDGGFGSNDYATLKRIGSRYGKAQVPSAGEYVVSVSPATPGGRELYEPMIKLKA